MPPETPGLDPGMRDLIQQSRREVLGGEAPGTGWDPIRMTDGVTPPSEEPARAVPPPTAPAPDNGQLPPPPTGERDEPEAFTRIDPNSLAPELQSIYRSMQGDYTRTKQEIAEQRRQAEALAARYQGLPDQTVEFARTVETLAAADPVAAADMLARQAEALRSAFQAPVPQAPYGPPEAGYTPYGDADSFQPSTDTEAYLFQQLQEVSRRQQSWEQRQQSWEQREETQRIQTELGQVDQLAGRALGLPEKVRLMNWAKERAVSLPDAYRLLYQEQILEGARAKAREEGMAAALAKAGLPPTGAGLASRDAPEREPTDPKEIARAEFRRLRGS
jgi:hypothetical protein